MTDTKTMMEKLQSPTKEQLEANIKVSHNWMTAVRSGTFQGHQAIHIATLLDFLETQNRASVKEFEAMMPAPEFGKPEEVAK